IDNLCNITAFLYTGPNAIQTGMMPGAIDCRQAAVIRGSVRTADGNALPGVRVTVDGHPELGKTFTRASGAFDIAVNGGGPVILNFAKGGFLPAQRRPDVPWLDYTTIPDVVLVPLDANVTSVAMGSPSFLIARGSMSSDASGN